DLGELSLPYYNPKLGRYQTASADLGELIVNPAAPADTAQATPTGSQAIAADAQPAVKLSELGRARSKLTRFTSKTASWAFSPWLWLVLLGAPLGVVAGQLTARRTRVWLSH